MVDRVGPTPAQEGDLVQADELFRQLDAQQIWHTRRVWHVRVDSITHENDEWWMQLRLAGPLVFDIVLHTGPSADARDVLRALRWWLEDSKEEDPRSRDMLASRDVRIRNSDLVRIDRDAKTQAKRSHFI